MEKRGQLLSQPFIYIFAIVLAALILLFGVMLINKINNQSEEVQLIAFISDLKTQVNNFYHFDPGSSKELNILLPKKIKQLCFYSNKYSITTELNHPDLKDLNLILQYPQSDNLYVIPLTEYSETRFTIPNLQPPASENPLCFIPKSGRLNAIIETKAYQNNLYVEIKRT